MTDEITQDELNDAAHRARQGAAILSKLATGQPTGFNATDASGYLFEAQQRAERAGIMETVPILTDDEINAHCEALEG